MNDRPAIVIPAYNRPEALARLLSSLRRGAYPPDVPLVISIDAGGAREREVTAVANACDWPHGPVRIIHHRQNIGLTGNVFFCGGLACEYGAVILLEDDLYAAQRLYTYAAAALDFYADDPRVAGIALNALWFNGYTHHPFVPYPDDGDVFFLQVAWFQGQAYTATQWQRFAEWRTAADPRVTPDDGLHPSLGQFPPTDWFPLKMKYLAQTNRFYVFPRESLTTNFGDVGTHFAKATDFFQVPLQHRRRSFRFLELDTAVAVYDTFQEMLATRLSRLAPALRNYDYAVDLNGTRSPAALSAPYALTSRPSRAPVRSYAKRLWPLEANVIEAISGDEIVLSRSADLATGRLADWRIASSNQRYFARGRTSLRQRLLHTLLRRL